MTSFIFETPRSPERRSVTTWEDYMHVEEERNEVRSCKAILDNWNPLEPRGPFYQPPNAFELFSVYAIANDCSFEQAMTRAADALLAQWKSSQAEIGT